jgi:hypothetical protein
MGDISDLGWFDFEVASAADLKAAGAFRYAADASTRAIILAYAIGDGPVRIWHADGAILDWDNAPDDLRAAFDRGATFGAWNASFDSAIWNYSTLGFPFLAPERVIDVMIQAGVSNLPTDLESASRYLGGEGKQKDGKKLIKLFCVEGADPREYPEEWERFIKYALRDVGEMRDVYRKTRPLPFAEWQQYWAFEHINRRGVALDMPFVIRAEALAAEDAIASGRRLSELTGKAVTRVTQAKRIATWLHDQLPDAAMREVLTVGVPADEDDDVCNGSDEDEQDTGPEFSLRRERVERLIAMLDVKRGNGGLSVSEAKAHEAATNSLIWRGGLAEKVRAPRGAADRRRAARPIPLCRSRADRPHDQPRSADSKFGARCSWRGWCCRSAAGRRDRRWLQLRRAGRGGACRCTSGAEAGFARSARPCSQVEEIVGVERLVVDRGANHALARQLAPR